MVLHRCFIVPWPVEKGSASIVPKSSVVFDDKGNIFSFLFFLLSLALVKKPFIHLSRGRTTKFETGSFICEIKIISKRFEAGVEARDEYIG